MENLLGTKISDKAELFRALTLTLEDPMKVKLYLLPPLFRLPIQQMVQAARLAAKMTEQSA